jgi:hypothetical protein
MEIYFYPMMQKTKRVRTGCSIAVPLASPARTVRYDRNPNLLDTTRSRWGIIQSIPGKGETYQSAHIYQAIKHPSVVLSLSWKTGRIGGSSLLPTQIDCARRRRRPPPRLATPCHVVLSRAFASLSTVARICNEDTAGLGFAEAVVVMPRRRPQAGGWHAAVAS